MGTSDLPDMYAQDQALVLALHHDVGLAFEDNITMFPSVHNGFITASILILKVGSFAYGIYLITATE